ncbi:type III secretion system regulator LcrR, partial [Vibrio parahaemolyticus AQ3810]
EKCKNSRLLLTAPMRRHALR